MSKTDLIIICLYGKQFSAAIADLCLSANQQGVSRKVEFKEMSRMRCIKQAMADRIIETCLLVNIPCNVHLTLSRFLTITWYISLFMSCQRCIECKGQKKMQRMRCIEEDAENKMEQL